MFHWHRYEAIAPWVNGLQVLEVGFGDGYGAAYLADQGATVTAIDIDPEAVTLAAQRYRHPRLSYRTASALDLPFEDARFDGVIAFEVLEHLAPHDQSRMLQEIRRVLRPTGFFVLSTPDRRRTALFPGTNPYHVGERTPEELQELVGQLFPVVRLAFQEIVPASIIWEPDRPQKAVPLWAFRAGQGPEPVGIDTHLPIILVAGVTDLPVTLSSVTVDNARRLLVRLWNDLDAQHRLAAEQQPRLAALNEALTTLQSQYDALWRENRLLADQIRDITPVLTELETLRAEHDRLIEAATQWEIVSRSRAWRLIRRYWYWLDHAPFRRILWWLRDKLIKRMSDS